MSEINVTDANFEQEVISQEGPVMVDFWAEWCGPCRMIAPMVSEIAEEYSGKIKVCKINVDDAPNTASKYSVMSIPTIAIFKGGEIVDKVVGAVPKSEVIARIDPHL
jgi:thioredoxin